jgi:hypothetical protein
MNLLACMALAIPRNAYLEAFGRAWNATVAFAGTAAIASLSRSPPMPISTIPATTGIATGRLGGRETIAWRCAESAKGSHLPDAATAIRGSLDSIRAKAITISTPFDCFLIAGISAIRSYVNCVFSRSGA